MWVIVSSDVFFDWKKLKNKLVDFYGLSRAEAHYLYTRTLKAFSHNIKENEIVEDYRVWLKADFYKELHMILNIDLLRTVSKTLSRINYFLISHFEKSRMIFQEHLGLFSKVFVPQEYKKHVYDPYFHKIVHAYVIKEADSNLRKVRCVSADPKICKGFSMLNVLSKCIKDAGDAKSYFDMLYSSSLDEV